MSVIVFDAYFYFYFKNMTQVQKACSEIYGYEELHKKFIRKMTINDRSQSTIKSYSASLAKMALFCKAVPTSMALDEIEEYLFTLKQNTSNSSDNAFKFAVCALRFVLRMEGRDELRVKLPVIRKYRNLPFVLSKEEVKKMINVPSLLKHRVMIALLYGCGLRCSELRDLRIADIDFHRGQILIKKGKSKKDRYVPLGNALQLILENYLKIYNRHEWVFTGHRNNYYKGQFTTILETQFGKRSIQWAIKRAAYLAGISKPVNVHSLRHAYATHLLEDGVSIVAIKELLGHADIKNTLVYLHIANIDYAYKQSPLDNMEGLRVIGSVQGQFSF